MKHWIFEEREDGIYLNGEKVPKVIGYELVSTGKPRIGLSNLTIKMRVSTFVDETQSKRKQPQKQPEVEKEEYDI